MAKSVGPFSLRIALRRDAALFPDAPFRHEKARVVVLDGADAGYLRLAREDGALRLLDLHVLPAHRGRGLGTAIVEWILAAGKELRYDAWAEVDEENGDLRAFLEARGMRVVARRHGVATGPSAETSPSLRSLEGYAELVLFGATLGLCLLSRWGPAVLVAVLALGMPGALLASHLLEARAVRGAGALLASFRPHPVRGKAYLAAMTALVTGGVVVWFAWPEARLFVAPVLFPNWGALAVLARRVVRVYEGGLTVPSWPRFVPWTVVWRCEPRRWAVRIRFPRKGHTVVCSVRDEDRDDLVALLERRSPASGAR